MPELPDSLWVGIDEAGGIPNPGLPDPLPAPHWRLDAVAATERPRAIDVSPDGARLVFTLDRDTSDHWTIDVPAPGATPPAPVRISTGRTIAAYWEDGGATWSPDGARVVDTFGGKVRVIPADGGAPIVVCDGSSPVWLDDRRLVVSVDRDDVTALAIVDLDDPWPRRLSPRDVGGDCGSATVSPDRRRVAFTVFHRDDLNCTSLHVVDVATGATTTIAHIPNMNVRSPAWSPDGNHLAFACEEPGWYELFVVASDGSGAPMSRTSGVAADFGDLAWSPDGASIVGVRSCRGVGDLVRVDASTGATQVLAPGGWWSSPKPLHDGRIVATHESFACAPRLCVVDRGAITALFAPTPAAVRVAPHVVPEHVSYPSADGTVVHGWLYRPTSASADHPCAAVVQPHGGPTSMTGDEWDGVAQYFVDRGYAWFAINVRGSTTYGRDYERSNHDGWGVVDTADCLAAHSHLATLDWVDARRVGIFGASYGSYMALHSVVDDPAHRYACAVSKYGDCDILTSWAQGDLVGRLDLERMMGHPGDRGAAYRAGSPIHRIDRLAVPIFVAHGEHDERVHPAQATELVDALRRLGKQFEYVTYRTEGHGLLRAGPFLHFHRRLERFLDWHLMSPRADAD